MSRTPPGAVSLSLLLVFCLVYVPAAGADNEREKPMVCYFSWRSGQSLTPDKLETDLCSHVILGFAGVGGDGLLDITGIGDDVVAQTVELRVRQPGLKVMLSIGGGGGGSGFSEAVRTKDSRLKLSLSILDLLTEYRLDGIDLDWEFPGWNTPTMDKANFALFVQDLREVLGQSLLLSVAVANKLPIIMASYNVTALAKFSDFINLMAYDFHGYSKFEDPFTGFNSPLFPRKAEVSYFATLNLAWAANHWVDIGMPREKIMVGIPTYAITYELARPEVNGVDAPAVGGGEHWTYGAVCELIAVGAETYFDEESRVPYAVRGTRWVSYENARSVSEKVKWVKSQQFGGIMTFSLNADDVDASCGGLTYPLHKTMRQTLLS